MCSAGSAPTGLPKHLGLAGLILAAASVIFVDAPLASTNPGVSAGIDSLATAAENLLPTAALVATPNHGSRPLLVVLDARGSSDPDGYLSSYYFDFGDGTGTTSVIPNVSHTYHQAGAWRATVIVIDNASARDTAGVDLVVTDPGNLPQPLAPGVHGPQELVALLKWCWEHRDADRYRELFTDDFRFTFVGDSSGTVWDRNQEVAAAASLFGSGTASQPGATSIALVFQGNWTAGSLLLAGKPYPWHQQVWVPNIWFQLTRSDGSTITTEGGTLFYLVRGDSAVIPQELRDRGFTRDSTRWYVEGWEDTPRWWPEVDHAPVVTAPAAIERTVNVPVTFQVTVSDPDKEAIESLHAEGPSGIGFAVAADKRSGTLSWTPTIADTGSQTITFVAANRLSGVGRTVVTVNATNRPPTAALVASPTQGTEPLPVTLDARGSSDPEGHLVSYRFDFGDGVATTSSNAVVSHTYQAGAWRATVTVTDDVGWTATAGVDLLVASANRPPTAALVASPTQGVEPLPVTLDARGSSDLDGSLVSYRFEFGDGAATTSSNPVVSHTYQAGAWRATVTVTDDAGWTATAGVDLTVAAGTVPGVNSPQEVVALLKWCWERRDADRYRELFTDDFRFTYVDGSADIGWDRNQELAAAARLFGPGTASQPGATAISLAFEGSWTSGSLLLADKPYPWHQQVWVPNVVFQMARSDGSTITARGGTLFYLVRGDSATIPQELRDRGFTRDSTRWYVERWEDTPRSVVVVDHAPVVTAPATYERSANLSLEFPVTVSDPDGHGIESLYAEGPSGIDFQAAANRMSGILRWTPTSADVGSRTVTFVAANRLRGAARTVITVNPGNRPPTAALVASPTQGTEPLPVTLDARGSSDPDGNPVSYHFDFGDGTSTTSSNPVVSHTYWAGSWRATVTVSDGQGPTAAAGVDLTVAAANLAKNASFEVDAQGWITDGEAVVARIEGGHEGQYALQVTGGAAIQNHFGINDSPNAVSRTTGAGVRLRFTAWVRSPSAQGTTKLLVREYSNSSGARLGEVFSVPARLTPEWQMLTVDYVTAAENSYLSFQVRDYPVAPGEVFLTDEISVRSVAVGGAVPNLAQNPSFEIDTQGWRTEGNAALDRVLGGQEGEYALRVTGSTAMQAHFGINDDPNVVYRTTSPGVRYRFTAWVRSPSAQGTAKLMVREYPSSSSAPLGEVFSMPVRLTPEWQMMSLDYVTRAANTTLSFQVRDYPVAPSEGFLIDGIAVRAVGVESWQPNLCQNPSFEIDTQGWKTDGDATLEKIPGGQEGEFALRVTGSAARQAHFGINDSPNTVYRTIAAGTVYRATAWVRSPSAQGTAKLLIREYGMSTAALLGETYSDPVQLTPEWQVLTLDYATTAENTTLSFQVRDYPAAPSEVFLTDGIAIRNLTGREGASGMALGPAWVDEDSGFNPLLAPNPVRDRGWLRFATREAGPLRVEVLDVAGRRVRRVLDENNAPAGVHELVLPRTGDNGSRLVAGVYFYRIEAQEGVRTGRFVVLE